MQWGWSHNQHSGTRLGAELLALCTCSVMSCLPEKLHSASPLHSIWEMLGPISHACTGSSQNHTSMEQNCSIHQPLLCIFTWQETNLSLKAPGRSWGQAPDWDQNNQKSQVFILAYNSSVHVKNILRKTEVSNIQQICIVSLMFSSASMFKFSQ